MTPKQLRDSANRPWEGELQPGEKVAPVESGHDSELGEVTAVDYPPTCDSSAGTLQRHIGVHKAHACPYESDVNDSPEFRCHCCRRCTQACADDV